MTGCSTAGRLVTMPKSDMVSGMRRKYVDKAIYHLLADAANGDTGFRLVGRNVFRPGVNRPKPDEFIVDCDTMDGIMRALGRRCA